MLPIQRQIITHLLCFQVILRRFGWTSAIPPNEAEAKLVGDGIRDAIRSVSGSEYESLRAWEFSPSSGGSPDWFYGPGKFSLAYTIELRDTGTYGFQLPADQIIPTGQESYSGFIYFATHILKN